MKVQISLHSAQTIDGETDANDMTAYGTWERLPDGWRLCYTESEQDGGASVTVTVCGGETVIERRGEISSRLRLQEGKRHECRYETPYGRMALHAEAKRIFFSDAEDTAVLRAVYTLDLNGACTEQEIEFRIKEVSQC